MPDHTVYMNSAELQTAVVVNVEYIGEGALTLTDSFLEAIGGRIMDFYRSTHTPASGYSVGVQPPNGDPFYNDAKGRVRVEWDDEDGDVPSWSMISVERIAAAITYAEIHKLLGTLDKPFSYLDWRVVTQAEYDSYTSWTGEIPEGAEDE